MTLAIVRGAQQGAGMATHTIRDTIYLFRGLGGIQDSTTRHFSNFLRRAVGSATKCSALQLCGRACCPSGPPSCLRQQELAEQGCVVLRSAFICLLSQ